MFPKVEGDEKGGRESPWPKVCRCNFVICSRSAAQFGAKAWGGVRASSAAGLVVPGLGTATRDWLGRYSLERVLGGRRKRKVQERANKVSKQIHPHQAECLKVTDMRGWRTVPFST